MTTNNPTAPMSEVVHGLPTKSAKIRALAKAGYARADIARFLGIRYQHVRNVLLQMQEAPAPFNSQTDDAERQWAQVAPDGRLVIPAVFRRHLGVESGGDVELSWDGKAMRVRSQKAAIREVQEMLAPFLKGTPSLADELIAERRAEALKE